MPSVEEKVAITATSKAIFKSLGDVERATLWMPGIVSVKRTSRKKAGVGLTTDIVANLAGREGSGTGRCLEWDPPRRLVLATSFDAGVTATSAFECEENGATTEVTARVEYTMPGKGFGKLVGGFVGDSMVRRDLKKALQNLKLQVESGAYGSEAR